MRNQYNEKQLIIIIIQINTIYYLALKEKLERKVKDLNGYEATEMFCDARLRDDDKAPSLFLHKLFHFFGIFIPKLNS